MKKNEKSEPLKNFGWPGGPVARTAGHAKIFQRFARRKQRGHKGPQGATRGHKRATPGHKGPQAGPVARCGPLVAPWRTCVRVLAGNQHVLQSEHAFAYWLATSTCFKANMRSRIGWQPARASKRTCVRVLAGNQHVLQSEHAFAYWLATNTSFKANMCSRPCCIFSYPFPPNQC